jgi:molybdopterin/thiamine biosynthesis adenylyltransferase
MSVPPEYFARLVGSVNFPLLQGKRVAIVGVGWVGSKIAEELANCGVGYLRLIDPDTLKVENLYRHALPKEYLDWNKAIGLADYLPQQVEGLRAESIAREIYDKVPGELLERWLVETDLVVVATDKPRVQKQVGQRALMLNIPSIFPALYDNGGGEVVVQFTRDVPCFGCFSAFREAAEPLHGVIATNFSAFPVIFTSLMLSMAILDPESEYSDLITERPDRRLNQLFVLNPFGALTPEPLDRREDCPACDGGPAPPAGPAVRTPPPSRVELLATPLPPSLSVWPTHSRAQPEPTSVTHKVFTAIGAVLATLGVVLGAIGAVAVGLVALCAAGFAAGYLLIYIPGRIFLWILGSLGH